jgi:hypothetical protein
VLSTAEAPAAFQAKAYPRQWRSVREGNGNVERNGREVTHQIGEVRKRQPVIATAARAVALGGG